MADPKTQMKPTYVGPGKVVKTKYPLIDYDPHIKRVIKYARPGDYLFGLGLGAMVPAGLCLWEFLSPSLVGKGAYPRILRLSAGIGVVGAFFGFYQRSVMRFYGMTENAREVEMDMREMVAKVKAGEPLYGTSSLSPHMQGVAARQGRYSALMIATVPWFNFVNHNQHGVDTAKYYQQAERELAMEADEKS